MSLTEVAAPIGGEARGECQFDRVSIDSRTLPPGALFVAIRGERFDGHDFVADVAARGAAGAIVMEYQPVDLPQLRVADTTRALGDLARLNRQRADVRCAAITGSQGKTTVKELLASICASAGPTLATQGNLNNAIGVPLTVLRLSREHRFAVLELGANGAGEIAWTVSVAQPQVAVLTNATPTHLEGFGSLAGIVAAKGEIIDGLGAEGTAVLNADDPHMEVWLRRAGHRPILSFGSAGSAADCRAEQIHSGAGGHTEFRLQTPAGNRDIQLQLLGRHNALNATAAAAAALALGIDLDTIALGLARVEAVPGRMRLRPTHCGAVLIDDSYNASPNSFRAAIDVLSERPGRRILVMGDMAEMGKDSPLFHQQVGDYARARALDAVWAVGDLSQLAVTAFGAGGRHFADREALVMALADELDAQSSLLVKGSRSAGMDWVADQLSSRGATTC